MFSFSNCFVFACKFSLAFTSLSKGPCHPFHCGVVTTGANERVFMGLPSFSGLFRHGENSKRLGSLLGPIRSLMVTVKQTYASSKKGKK